MKKHLMGIALLALLLTACTSNEEADSKADQQTQSTESASEETGGAASVDKGLLNVEVTVPGSFFEGEDLEEVVAKAKEDGIKNAIVNDDGSVTYKMTRAQHKEMMQEMKTNLTEYVDELITDQDFASIHDIIYNKNFSEFTITVDKDAFENSFDGFAVLGLGMSGMLYQVYDGVNPDKMNVRIDTVDESSGEMIGRVNYPEDLGEGE